MLDVTNTAHEGAGLSTPCVIDRAAQPYVALPAAGSMAELPRFAPQRLPELHEWMRDNAVVSGMEGFFRYREFGNDGSVRLEVGTTTPGPVAASGEVIADALPAGRYAFATHTGSYDRLYDAFLMLDGWIRGRGLTPDGERGPEGVRPACQIEIYRVSPMDTDDAGQWQTDLLVKLAD